MPPERAYSLRNLVFDPLFDEDESRALSGNLVHTRHRFAPLRVLFDQRMTRPFGHRSWIQEKVQASVVLVSLTPNPNLGALLYFQTPPPETLHPGPDGETVFADALISRDLPLLESIALEFGGASFFNWPVGHAKEPHELLSLFSAARALREERAIAQSLSNDSQAPRHAPLRS